MVDWPLTGRREEVEVLEGLLNGEADYAGVVIAGRAGVGKTRLAREVTEAAAQRGWAIRSLQGTPAAQAIPLGAFAQWIDQLDGQPLNLVGAVIAAVTASPQSAPVLVAVDDAHLLDDLSAFVLHQLVRRGGVVVIATLRSGESAPATITAMWKDGNLCRLDLQPLSHLQCQALLGEALCGEISDQCAKRMWELTSGNVLFLKQLVKQELQAGRLIRDDQERWQWTGSLTVSPTLSDLVDISIGEAPEPVLEILDLLALAEPLELVYLSALADPADIEDAERRDLIRVMTKPLHVLVRLGHPLYGESRRARMGQMRARRLRARIAEAMRAPHTGIGAPDPVRLGLLWLESDLPPDPDVLHRGAAAAIRRLDVPLSERLSASAIRAGAGTESHVLHARTLSLLGRADEVEELLTALPAWEHDETWVAATTLRATNLMLAQCEPEKSWSVIEEALAQAPARLVQDLLAFRAFQLAMAARPREVIELVESMSIDQLKPRSRINLNYGTTIALSDLGRIREATQTPEDDLMLAVGSPIAAFQSVALALMHADAMVLGGHIAEAVVLGERLGRRWTDLPEDPQTIANGIKGVAALACGDLPTSIELLGAALATDDLRDEFGGSAVYFGVGYWLRIARVSALARSGSAESAAAALVEMQRGRHQSFAFLEPSALLAAAWVAAAGERPTEALDLVNQATEFTRTRGQCAREVFCLQTAIQFGDTRNHSVRLDELAALVEGPRASIIARWAAARAGNDGEVLMSVSSDLEAMGDRIAAADAAAHAVEAFGRKNLRGSKFTARARATRLIAGCDATTPATRVTSVPLPLSSREREIATLVRDGMSNKDIAAALTMSVRTVEGHLYRACNKLGLANRTELAGLMGQFTG